jgi:hypothetical protein
MNALELIESAAADGVGVELCEGGALRLCGARDGRDRWREVLAANKASIVKALRGIPGDAGVSRIPSESDRRKLWAYICELTKDAKERETCFLYGLREIDNALRCYSELVEEQRQAD